MHSYLFLCLSLTAGQLLCCEARALVVGDVKFSSGRSCEEEGQHNHLRVQHIFDTPQSELGWGTAIWVGRVYLWQVAHTTRGLTPPTGNPGILLA